MKPFLMQSAADPGAPTDVLHLQASLLPIAHGIVACTSTTVNSVWSNVNTSA